jgi:predicted small secreted protein
MDGIMKKLKMILLIILCAIFLTSCSNPVEDYRQQIKEAITNYDIWNQGAVAAYNQLQETKTSGNPDVSYGELIINTIQNHVQGDQRRADLTWDPADYQVFKGQIQQVYNGARPLLTELENMTPPDNMKDAHLVLQECVKYQMNIAATVLIFLNDNKFEPVNYSVKPCENVDGALEALKTFTGSNQ